jgi:hypothetical protein
MPWVVEDVDKHKKGLTDKQKRQWVRIANSVLASCKKKGGTDEACAPGAIKWANGVVGNNAEQYSIYKNVQKESYEVKIQKHQGLPYLVVPVTMMVEGVHSGNHGPLLHTMNDLGKFPESWNGIPVIINHPEVDGVSVSANSPDIVEKDVVGRVYNTFTEGSKLKAEVWINEERLFEKSPDVLEKINNGEELEVSVGVFTEEQEEPGIWNNEEYVSIARNHRPDHLAILPDAKGACSLKDGCGIRVNKNNEIMDVNATVTDMEGKRKELGMSVSEFYAVPKDPPSDSKLPIFDEAHVRNAMARFSQTQGLSTEEKAKARRKIIAKAKKFKIDTTGFEKTNTNMEEELLSLRDELSWAGYSISSIGNNADAGYKEKMDAVNQALREKDTNNSYSYLEELYDDTLIYSVSSLSGTKLYKQSYKFSGGTVEFVGDAIEVHRKVDYVVNSFIRINKNKEVTNMDTNKCPECVKKINALIANKESGFTEDDREWLNGLPETALDKVSPKIVERVIEKPVEVNKLTPEQQSDLAFVAKQRADKRSAMIQGIQDNTSKEIWPDAILTTMQEDVLERLFNSVKKEEPVPAMGNYSLQSAGFNTNNVKVEPLLPAGVELKK